MSNIMTEPQAFVNADLAQGLREIADFLEQHPDLPAFRAYLYGNARSVGNARPEMLAFAALFEDPTERCEYGRVRVAGRFTGNVEMELTTSVESVGGRKPEPDYEPIVGPKAER